jgi:hypothetical protein
VAEGAGSSAAAASSALAAAVSLRAGHFCTAHGVATTMPTASPTTIPTDSWSTGDEKCVSADVAARGTGGAGSADPQALGCGEFKLKSFVIPAVAGSGTAKTAADGAGHARVKAHLQRDELVSRDAIVAVHLLDATGS